MCQDRPPPGVRTPHLTRALFPRFPPALGGGAGLLGPLACSPGGGGGGRTPSAAPLLSQRRDSPSRGLQGAPAALLLKPGHCPQVGCGKSCKIFLQEGGGGAGGDAPPQAGLGDPNSQVRKGGVPRLIRNVTVGRGLGWVWRHQTATKGTGQGQGSWVQLDTHQSLPAPVGHTEEGAPDALLLKGVSVAHPHRLRGPSRRWCC